MGFLHPGTKLLQVTEAMFTRVPNGDKNLLKVPEDGSHHNILHNSLR